MWSRAKVLNSNLSSSQTSSSEKQSNKIKWKAVKQDLVKNTGHSQPGLLKSIQTNYQWLKHLHVHAQIPCLTVCLPAWSFQRWYSKADRILGTARHSTVPGAWQKMVPSSPPSHSAQDKPGPRCQVSMSRSPTESSQPWACSWPSLTQRTRRKTGGSDQVCASLRTFKGGDT